jgi:apolipoprotein N-acyltransferase
MGVSAARAAAAAPEPSSAHATARRRAALATASGVLLALCYAPAALTPLAWIALVPLLLAVDGASPGGAAGVGWLTGTTVGLGVCGHWMWRAAIDYFGLTPAVAGAFTAGVVEFFVAPYFAAFAVLAVVVGRHRWRVLAIPAAFVATELARATLVGNAWALLGHSQRSLVLLQSTSVAGAYGVSFLLAMSNTALADVLRLGGRGAVRRAAPAGAAVIVALAVVLGFGSWRLRHPPATTGTLRALLVQGNVSNAERARADRAAAIVERYVALSASAQPGPALMLWPENAITVFPPDNPELLAPVRALAASSGAAVLAGAPRAGTRVGSAAIYNSAYRIAAEGSRPVYDKRRLLPFVERFALRPQDGPYLAGTGAVPVPVGAARLGVLICYEAIFPGLAAGPLAAGANALANLSNDSWFEAGAGPLQHYELARFRAVESGVALLRATNSGVSGAFDPVGRELVRLPRAVAVAQAVEVPLAARPSFYARHGDWFAILCVAFAIAAVATRRR